MTKYEAEKGLSIYRAVEAAMIYFRDKGVSYGHLIFNEIEVPIRWDSHPGDVCLIYNLMSEIRYLKSNNTIQNHYE